MNRYMIVLYPLLSVITITRSLSQDGDGTLLVTVYNVILTVFFVLSWLRMYWLVLERNTVGLDAEFLDFFSFKRKFYPNKMIEIGTFNLWHRKSAN